jgi:hypothetical protein
MGRMYETRCEGVASLRDVVRGVYVKSTGLLKWGECPMLREDASLQF